MALSPDEISARIKAARILRGITQDDLAKQLHEAGLSWRLAGDLERGEQTMLSAHRGALSKALGFSERWFTVPLDEVCPDVPDEQVMEQLAKVRLGLDEIIRKLEGE